MQAFTNGFRRSRSRLWAILFLPLLLAGCAHYQLGTAGKLAFTTLYVAPVASTAVVPQARALVSAQLRQVFLQDGRVTLVDSPAAADVTLQVTLTNYGREAAVAQRNDTGLARVFNLTLGATCTLHDNRTGKDLFAGRPIRAAKEAFTDSGQLQAEYDTLPLLAASLAQSAAHAVLDVW